MRHIIPLIFACLVVLLNIVLLACGIVCVQKEGADGITWGSVAAIDSYLLNYTGYVCIGVSLFTILISSLVFVGVFVEEAYKTLFMTYGGFLIFILAIQVICEALFLYFLGMLDYLVEDVKSEFGQSQSSLANRIDQLQRYYKCCGLHGPESPSTRYSMSCLDLKALEVYKSGCLEKAEKYSNDIFVGAVVFFIFLVLVEIASLAITMCTQCCCEDYDRQWRTQEGTPSPE